MKKVLGTALFASVLSCSVFADNTTGAVVWAIDYQGVPYSNLTTSSEPWAPQGLPNDERGRQITGDYYYADSGREYSAFVTTWNYNVYKDSADGWQQIQGCGNAWDVAAFGIDNAYCVNRAGAMSKYDPELGEFTGQIRIEGESIKQIDVDENGTVWALTDNDLIFKRANDSWAEVDLGRNPPCANNRYNCNFHDIRIKQGQFYVIAHHPYGRHQYKLQDGVFSYENNTKQGGALDRDGTFWFVSFQYRFDPPSRLKFQKPGMEKPAEDTRFRPFGNSVLAFGG